MAGRVPNHVRDQLLPLFRDRICDKVGFTPLPPQRQWWCAADGLVLHPGVRDPQGVPVMLEDKSIQKWAVSLRPAGIARLIGIFGAFKFGKSAGTGMWAAGFAGVPGAHISLLGLEYSMVEPEFNYICEFLLSERGMGLQHASLQNRPKDGKMWLELKDSGAIFDAYSWERKETLKGKERDGYIFCEAYQLPGFEAYTSIKQNLSARQGFAIFPTTPDRPWLKTIHDHGHGQYADWECICGVPRSVNPFTFNAEEAERDKELMTSEKYQIGHMGQFGDFVGHVFNYSRGTRTFTPNTHPELFPKQDQKTFEEVIAAW